MPGVWQYLHHDLMHFFHPKDRNEAIDTLVESAVKQGLIPEKNPFREAIEEREKLVTTGIGKGVALPHAKIKECSDFFIAVGIFEKGVEWEALDHSPVQLVFLIGGPDDRPTHYLQLLSEITILLKDEKRREALLKAETTDEVLRIFENL